LGPGPANDFLLGYKAEHWRPTKNKKDCDTVNIASTALARESQRAREVWPLRRCRPILEEAEFQLHFALEMPLEQKFKR
jgi:hypothetical protein